MKLRIKIEKAYYQQVKSGKKITCPDCGGVGAKTFCGKCSWLSQPGQIGFYCSKLHKELDGSWKADVPIADCNPCPTCNGKCYLWEERKEIDVPDGYEFVDIYPSTKNEDVGLNGKAVFHKGGISKYLYKELPYAIGQVIDYVCEVCGGKTRKCTYRGIRGGRCKYYKGCEDYKFCSYNVELQPCPSCNGSPNMKLEVISIDVKDKTFIALFKEV